MAAGKNKDYISEKVKKDVCEDIELFLLHMKEEINVIGKQEAVEVLSILVDFKEFFLSKNLWENYVYTILEKIKEGIYNLEYREFSFFHGLTDIAFVIRHLLVYIPELTKFLQSLEKLQLNYLNNFLHINEESGVYLKNNYFELIAGISSPLRYWIDVGGEDAETIVTRMINFLIKNGHSKTILGSLVPGWHYFPLKYESQYMAYPAPNGCINYGVSHGMGGPLQVLALTYHRGIYTEGLLEMIQTLIQIYKNSAYYVNDIVYWPGRIAVEEYINSDVIHKLPNRMSWCYGSVGILRVIYLASKWISDIETEQYAIKELLKIARMDNERYGLISPIICHGYAGVAAIMNEMYRDTGNNLFKEKTIDLIIKTNTLMKKNIKDIPDIKKYSYLEGQSGILQTLYYITTNKINDNLKRLLVI